MASEESFSHIGQVVDCRRGPWCEREVDGGEWLIEFVLRIRQRGFVSTPLVPASPRQKNKVHRKLRLGIILRLHQDFEGGVAEFIVPNRK